MAAARKWSSVVVMSTWTKKEAELQDPLEAGSLDD